MNVRTLLATASFALYGTSLHAQTGNVLPSDHSSEEYYFDTDLFRGGNISTTALKRIEGKEAIPAGSYNADIYLNGQYLTRGEVRVENTGESQSVLMSAADFDKVDVKKKIVFL